MSGTFSKSARPTRPGGYFAFQAVVAAPPQPGVEGIVAVPFTADWGPSEVPVLLRSFADYQNVFGLSTNTLGYRDVYQAFEGEGLPGFGGAGAVLAYRMSGSAAAKASHAFQNTTPAAAITITAIYEGTRGNSLNVTIQAAAGLSGVDQLVLYDGATQIEFYNFSNTGDVATLVAEINASSQWITATQTITGVPLTHVANVSLTGGLGGESLVTADWTNMLAAIQVQQFAVIGAEWPTADSATMTALLAWVIAMRAAGKMFRVVIGGLLNETSSTGLARSASFNHEAVINIGQGSVLDSNLAQTLSTGMLAPRVAGIVAARGESMSLTYARFQGLTILIGATDAEIAAAFAGGMIVLARDSNLDAPVRIDKGVNTYTTTTNTAKPYLIYRNPKFIATMDDIQSELTSFAEQQVIGKMEVNPSSRAFVRSQISQTLRLREAQGIVQPGWTVADDFNPPATPQDEFMQFIIGLVFGRSAEQVFFTASVS